MKRKLLIVMGQTIIIGLLLSFGLANGLISAIYERDIRSNLKSMLAMMCLSWEEGSDAKEFAHNAAAELEKTGNDIRVTVIALDGAVLADSKAKKPLANHLERIEVQQAIKTGYGFDSRRSDSMNNIMEYCAQRVDDTIIRIALNSDTIFNANVTLMLCGAAGVILGGLIALAASNSLARQFITPIMQFTKAAEAMAGGDYDMKVPSSDDEIGMLGAAFNSMGDNISRTMSQLEQNRALLNGVLQGMDNGVLAIGANNKVLIANNKAKQLLLSLLDEGEAVEGNYNLIRLTEHIKSASKKDFEVATDENYHLLGIYSSKLNQPKAELIVLTDITRLRKLENLRSEFVANVTHELKTPLTSIRGYVELLKSGDRDKETCKRFYDIIEIESERLQHMIEDLLSLSEIENGTDPVFQTFDAMDVLTKTLQVLRPVAQNADVELFAVVSDKVLSKGNPRRFQQLLTNLIDNAVKYNVPGGSVTVEIKRDKHFVSVRVTDTGIGISDEHFNRLFERFYRVDKSRSREKGGTGLGLSIVKHIVALYNGDIRIQSKVDEGTTFFVRLKI